MSHDYWLGVASAPALVLGLAALWLAAKLVAKLGERLFAVALLRLGASSKLTQRVATACVVYGAKRSYMLAGGDVAVVLVVGLDHERKDEAANLLRPRVSLRKVRED